MNFQKRRIFNINPDPEKYIAPVFNQSVKTRLKKFKVNEKKIFAIKDQVCKQLSISHLDVSISFVGPRRIQSLNKQFRGMNKSTDVLSFPQMHWDKPLSVSKKKVKPSSFFDTSLGDLVISVENAMKNALYIGQPLDREIAFLVVHGILHLCGHDHEHPKDELLMLKQQKTLMRSLLSPAHQATWKNCVKIKGKNG